MEQLALTNDSLQKIFERAQTLRQELGGQRYFPAVVAHIAGEIGGGYRLSPQEQAAVQSGVLACQAAAKAEVIIPAQSVGNEALVA